MTEKRIQASDVIGNSYYNYTLTSTNNTPSINSTISITCSVTDIYGQSISGKSITLYLNGVSQGARTTASNGSATWNNITMSTSGLQVFSVENSKIEVFVDNKSEVGHTHTSSQISDLSIPSASTTLPSVDTANGSYGTGTTWARSNHSHPKSSIYAEASHTHSNYVNPTIYDGLDSNSTSSPLSARQGKILNDKFETLGSNVANIIYSDYSVFVNDNEGYYYEVTNGGFTTVTGEDNTDLYVDIHDIRDDFLTQGYVLSYDVQALPLSDSPIFMTADDYANMTNAIYHIEQYWDSVENSAYVNVNNGQMVSQSDFISFKYNEGYSNTNWVFSNIKLVKDGYVRYNDISPQLESISSKEDKGNKVTSLSSSNTDTQYPSAKAVYDNISPYIYDSGWVAGSTFMNTNVRSYDENHPHRIRRIGKVVHMEGIVKNNNTFGGDGSGTKISTAGLPAQFRPATHQYSVQQGSGSNKFLLHVYPNGDIYLERYGTTSYTDVSSGSWLHMNMTWFVD